MQNSKLIKVIQTFTDKEKKLFLKFVHSPYYNENEKVCQFANYLLASKDAKKTFSSPEMEEKFFKKEQIFVALYPDRKFDAKADTDIRLLMSYLFRLLKKFLIVLASENEDESVPLNLLLAEQLFNRNLGEFALAEINEIYENQEKKTILNFEFFYERFLIRERKAWGETLVGIRSPKKQPDTQGFLNDLDVYYILKKMAYHCVILNDNRIFTNNLEPEMMQAILTFVKNTPHIFEIPTVQMYYYAILLFQSKENSEYYDAFFQLLKNDTDKCGYLDLRNLHTYARNYCIRRKNLGDNSMDKQLFELYQEQLKIGVLYDRGEISVSTVKNIVTLALQLDKSDWLLNVFLPEHSAHIDELHRENTLNYCHALISFYNKDYDKCLYFVKQNDKPDSFFDVGSRRLAIKSFYELQEEESTLNDLRTFRKFLYDCSKKKQLPENTIQGNRVFCNILERLIALPPFQKERLQKLQEEMEQAALCLDKDWLEEKLKMKF